MLALGVSRPFNPQLFAVKHQRVAPCRDADPLACISPPSLPPSVLSVEGKNMQAQHMACGPGGLSVWREEQSSSLLVSFSPYLCMFKVVTAADSVCQKDLCTRLQFIGQRMDKWSPPTPSAPNVSHGKKTGRSRA